ncbi:MAG: UDP-glucose--hexose-1-phosphate uridylyltransferase [Clostridia bacterium]|nr:UDP-glucose--hexose-1-phosphate uridylyltransferase [Clostridia bacterium]
MLNKNISQLLAYGIRNELIQPEDTTYVANRILNLIGESGFEPRDVEPEDNIEKILEPLLDAAAKNGKLEADTTTYRDIMSADIMDLFTPVPSVLCKEYFARYADSPKKATDYFYRLSQSNNYIMTRRISKNVVWKTPSEKYGELDITINLSKPEKDPRDIANAKKQVQTGYPKCLLCKENVGYEGNVNHPPRSNHRVIPVDINNEKWYLQYSPYGYYNEHCILLRGEHSPMSITKTTFDNLLEFVSRYPHYFIGSNADLPIVGGSILTHDHYQGGNYEFPMAKCGLKFEFVFDGYDDVKAGVVNWPLSTIRLRGSDRARLSQLADKILTAWRGYSDPDNEIYAFSGDENHNTITPIALTRGGDYELDLILRNNRTSEEHPLGIFHPHSEYHYIKKENIGLIEAMGLAVLPPRLLTQFGELTDSVKNEIGTVFGEILENCGVFKDDEKGDMGFKRFLNSI